MIWVPRWLGEAHARLVRAFAYRPFTSAEARLRLGGDPRHANLALSRLARAGWVGRLAHGWYVAVPSRAIQSGLVTGWDARLRNREVYPCLAVGVGRALEVLGPRLTAIALFGSAARGEPQPESDLDLLVVADFESRDPRTWLESLASVREVSEAIAFRQWERMGAYHGVQVVPFRPEQIEEPGPLFLDLTEDAIVIEDPRRVLGGALASLRSNLRRSGARRRQDSKGFRYWDLQPNASVRDQVEA